MPNVQNAELKSVINNVESMMKKVLEKMAQEFSSLRTGRATGTLLDNVRVNYYGTATPLKQVAAVGVPDGRTIEIKPWDATVLPEIEKAIQTSDLGLTPNNDGKLIRITIPALTEDRRKDLVRQVKKLAEEFRVAVRNDRREGMDKIKKAIKDKGLPEDEGHAAEEALQKLTDSYIKKVDESLSAKEADIMEV